MEKRRSDGTQSGFSIVELLIVVAIMLIVSAMAVPNMINAVANVRLRSSVASVQGVLQQTRMLAVKDNRPYSARATTIGNMNVIYVDVNNNNRLDAGEPISEMAATVTPTSVGFPTLNGSLSFVPQPATSFPSFNSRGLPCQVAGASSASPTAACNTAVAGVPVGYAFYFSDTRSLGTTGWAAISITPAGRVRVWSYDGANWN